MSHNDLSTTYAYMTMPESTGEEAVEGTNIKDGQKTV